MGWASLPEPRIECFFHGLPVDSVHERLAHPEIIERWLGVVDVEALLPAGPTFVEHCAHFHDLGFDIRLTASG